MAKLYFYYSSMNAGKSTSLLQSSYNYRERGMNTLVLAPALDDRYGTGKVASRIGLESEATTFASEDNLFDIVQSMVAEAPLHCVLVDEAQTASTSRCSPTACAPTSRASPSKAASTCSRGRTT
jgi:thymidine kinase